MRDMCDKHGPYSTFCRQCDLEALRERVAKLVEDWPVTLDKRGNISAAIRRLPIETAHEGE